MTQALNRAFQFPVQFPSGKTLVTQPGQLLLMLNELAQAPAVAFDFETTGLAWYKDARACGLALGWMPSPTETRCWYIPFRHATGEQQLTRDQVWPVADFLFRTQQLKIAHNVKFDEHMARRDGWTVLGPRYDTMIAARFYDENRSAALKERAATDLGEPGARTSEMELKQWIVCGAKDAGLGIEAYSEQMGYSGVPIQVAGVYACYDVDFTLRLWQLYEGKHKISQSYPRVWQTEMDLTRVLHEMEENGLPVDLQYLGRLSDLVRQRKVELQREMQLSFNLGSDNELRDYLVKTLNVPLSALTKGGQKEVREARHEGRPPDLQDKFSVDSEVLAEHGKTWPILLKIIAWREADKIDTTYTSSLLARVGHDGRLHGDFQQVGTNTGRLSCRNPNFQNFSSDDNDRALEATGKGLAEGGVDPYSVRRIFAVPAGTPRFFFDYSQIELRVITYYSKDPVMSDVYLTGGDIHSRTALEVWGSEDKVYRRRAKVVNYGLSFCMTEIGFARQAGIPVDEAAKYLATFFEKYRGISQLRETFWEFCRKNGCQFLNLFGRPRRIPDLASEKYYLRGRAERQAIGSLIQGTAAELTKESLVRIWKWLRTTGYPVKLVNTVHDEIQMDVPAACIAEVVTRVKALMEDYPEFAPIPIIASVDYSETSWADKKPLKV